MPQPPTSPHIRTVRRTVRFTPRTNRLNSSNDLHTAAGELAGMAAELLKIMAVFKYTNSQTGLATVSVS